MDFLKALKVLTVLPVPVEDDPLELEVLTPWFPLAGAVIGGLLLLVHDLSGLIFPETVTSVIVVFFWVFIGRGRAIKAMLNWVSPSGYVSHRSSDSLAESILYGALGVMAIILLKASIISALKWQFLSKALILAPVVGSWGVTIGISPVFLCLNGQESLLLIAKKLFLCKQFIYGSSVALALSLLLSGFAGLVLFIIVGAIMLFFSHLFSRHSKSATMESAYSVGEVGELLVLMSVLVMMQLFIMGY